MIVVFLFIRDRFLTFLYDVRTYKICFYMDILFGKSTNIVFLSSFLILACFCLYDQTFIDRFLLALDEIN